MALTQNQEDLLKRGLMGSGLALLLLVLVQILDESVLDIPNAWLGIAAIPAIMALFASGLIKTFKGFGLELEARLENVRVPELPDLGHAYETARDLAQEDQPRMNKGGVGTLHDMGVAERNNFRRLVFQQPSSGYTEHAVGEYLELLEKVEWLEIVDSMRGFSGVIERRDVPPERVAEFVDALRSNRALEVFPSVGVSHSIGPNEGVSRVIQRLREIGSDYVPVVTDQRLVSVIRRSDVAQVIGESILSDVAPESRS